VWDPDSHAASNACDLVLDARPNGALRMIAPQPLLSFRNSDPSSDVESFWSDDMHVFPGARRA